jgi:hypothetical protein
MSIVRGQKAACYDKMEEAYDENEVGGVATPRNIAYSLRRLTGLGDRLDMHAVCQGTDERPSIIDQFIVDHPILCASWDIVRDARGDFVTPSDTIIPLSTLDVRGYISRVDGFDPRPHLWPSFAEEIEIRGPGDEFGSVLYIEKEGFNPLITASGLRGRYSLATASSKGYSNRAAKALLAYLAGLADEGIAIFVVHDFDNAGLGIATKILDRIPAAVGLGLRWDDVTDPTWGPLTVTGSEAVTYPHDPRPRMRANDATDDEIDFLVTGVTRSAGTTRGGRPTTKATAVGRRVELNALPGPRFIEWLESKLDAEGVSRLVPTSDVLEAAWTNLGKRVASNKLLAAARDDGQLVVPSMTPDLVTKVARMVEDDDMDWRDALADLMERATDGE